MHLHEACALFLAFKRAEGLSPKTITWYADLIGQFGNHLPQHRTLADVTAIEIALWLSHESERGLRPASVDARYRALQAFFGWCEEQDLLKQSPFGYGRRKRVRRPKRPMPVVDYVKYTEYQQVIAAIDLATWLDYRDYCLCSVL